MWIVRLALSRPYTFVVAALVLLLLTPLVLLRMPTDIFPSINIPVISVVWSYNGLSSKEIEQRIVYNHERMIATVVNDIEHTESTSYNGVGVIKIFLQPGASVPEAVAQVTASGQTILRMLPPGITPPFIIRYNASSVPILQYALSSSQLPEQELQDLAMNRIRIGLSNVRGASIPMPAGGKTRIVAVDLDLPALESKHLVPQDVIGAINAQNLVVPGGTVKIGTTEYNVSLNGSPVILDELNDLPIKTVNGVVIRIRDVAQVHDGAMPQQNVVRLDGARGVLLTVLKSGTASTLQVVHGAKKAMERIVADLPPAVTVKEFADQSLFVKTAVGNVVKEGIIAAALTALMILFFLGAWRSTLIVTVSIPLSILASLAVLSALGETINLMTLGGLALSVGILVDDATVTVENIHNHLARGKPVVQAILDGAQEVALPAFVSTLSICIVFVPMFFLSGVARHLFVPLAEAVVIALIASYILSRTLVPTLVMWFYGKAGSGNGYRNAAVAATGSHPPTKIFARFENGFDRFKGKYRTTLSSLLSRRGVFIIFFMVLCGAAWLLLPFLGQDFFPSVDAGQFRLHVRARAGTRIEQTVSLVSQVEKAIRTVVPSKEIAGIMDNIGVPSGGIPLTYIDNGLVGTGDADIYVSLNHGHRPTAHYVKQLRSRLNREFPGVEFYFLPADIVNQTINFSLPAPIDIQIAGRDRDGNHAVAEELARQIRSVPGAVDVRVQQPTNQPDLRVSVDRTIASKMGITERDVANQLLLSLSGSSQSQPNFWLNPKNSVQYPVSVQVPQYAITTLAQLKALPITGGHSGKGGPQLLTNISSTTLAHSSPTYSHYNVQPVIDVYAGVHGRDMGGVLRDIAPIVRKAEKDLPKGSSISVRGQATTMRSSFLGLGIGVAAAIVLVYLLLVVNFQSWRDPFIIITALPGALAGVIAVLFLTFTTLSVPALLGTIMSIGVGTANSILLVSFARDNLRKGMEPTSAVLDAATTRLRPVLMTALAMIIGMFPIALGMGEGGEQNAPLGRAVIGGLAAATVATLFFVPVMFRILHGRTEPAGVSNA